MNTEELDDQIRIRTYMTIDRGVIDPAEGALYEQVCLSVRSAARDIVWVQETVNRRGIVDQMGGQL